MYLFVQFGDFPIGETEVTYRARDESGNEATCKLTITVQGRRFLKKVGPG